MKKRIENTRSKLKPEDFGSLRELKTQPSYVANGTLLGHQLDGLNWLQYQWERKQACILADDMGLGKTIQVVTFLDFLLNKYNLYPFLLVVPNSTVTNWVREFNKWAPDMAVVAYFGSRQSRALAAEYEIFRNGRGHNQISCHAVVMTYESALADMNKFTKLDIWPYLIVDEAQRLKNKSSLLFKKLADIKTDNRVLLTGTPLQNNISELINIMNFVDPSTFKDVAEISEEYAELNHENVQQLHRQLKPYFLRRTKDVVLKNLPPKKEIIVPLSMTRLQKELYKDTMVKGTKLVAQLQKQFRGETDSGGKMPKQNYNNVLMSLRKILNHPYLLPGVEVPYDTVFETQTAMVDACGKLKLLHIMLPKLFAQGHRVLIFSTMSIALDVLEDYMDDANIKYVRLDGNTKQVDRVDRIDAFNAPNSDVKVFLLTTRAGGVGINLATSDTVIVYDSDFNPHADLQAISRAHRFGQKNPVLVLRFITRFSVEERIVEKSKKKMVLDHLVVDKMDEEEMESDDVESILKFGLKALFDEDTAPKDIVYDSAAVDDLLNRESIFTADVPESPEIDTPDETKNTVTPNMSFSFARIWQRYNKPQTGSESSPNSDATENQENVDQDKQDKDVWDKLLAENQQELEKEALLATENLGRGARKRKAIVSYHRKNIKRRFTVPLLTLPVSLSLFFFSLTLKRNLRTTTYLNLSPEETLVAVGMNMMKTLPKLTTRTMMMKKKMEKQLFPTTN
ncbi:P-loop containing nucleoside triphosphate hydrolase protein [Chlamydoabsidia padenii]|nr:P-loop containing nucleoside triphosphate hydrolase protein [Chlamydoabsidia padenii]